MIQLPKPLRANSINKHVFVTKFTYFKRKTEKTSEHQISDVFKILSDDRNYEDQDLRHTIEDPTLSGSYDNDSVVRSIEQNVEHIGNPIPKRCYLDNARGCHINNSYQQRDLNKNMGVVHGTEDRRLEM